MRCSTLYIVRQARAMRSSLPKPEGCISRLTHASEYRWKPLISKSTEQLGASTRSSRAHGVEFFPAMSWSYALGRLRSKTVWSSLVRPGCAMVLGRHPSAQGGGFGAALAGNSSAHHPSSSELATFTDTLGQRRGMATSNSRHKKVIKMAKG